MPQTQYGTEYYETGQPTVTQPVQMPDISKGSGVLNIPGLPASNADIAHDFGPKETGPKGTPEAAGTAPTSESTPAPPSTQQDINKILEPYINEMMNLGPEYSKEMEFLKPYLTGTGAEAPQTFSQLEAGSVADESPTGSKMVNEADQAAGNALENQPAPGFGQLATAAKQYEGTVPYSDILQTVLGAGKNEILYGTVPNLSNIETQGWPSSLQQAYGYLTQNATGTNAATGLNTPASAAAAAAKSANTGGTTSGGTTGGTNT